MRVNPSDLLSQHERNVVILARRLDSDFEAVARELGGKAETHRATFEAAKAKLQGKPAPTPTAPSPPQPKPERRLTVAPETTRTTDDVLTDALAELERRRDELLPLIGELKNIDKAITTLRKATGMTHRDARQSPNGKRTYTVSEQTCEKVLASLDTDGPVDRQTIADRAGIAVGPYLYAALNQLVEDGKIVKLDDGYALTAEAVA